ncbi:integrase (plasmid) [Pandoraea faecigallinarum]|uniref:Integrase n=1 Tax=Pandoraea faecigallinarum TaxID=656179 RepID=A0A0H3X2U2_9BURK|nr:site-specific integrase [Pandoraea faecigallinarum]AKM33303.1 integrase [Pandoraea faecigallinarum]
MLGKRAKTLKPAQIRGLLRVTEATSRHPERAPFILRLSDAGGMRISEIARNEVADQLQPSGLIREEVSLRAAITKGCRQRCVYRSHPKTLAALDRYIEWRWEKGKGTAMDRQKWRGLMSQTSLILTHKGSRYELSVKRRTNDAGEQVEYLAADSLQSYVTALYRAAGLGKGYSSHSGRRTFASRRLAQGHAIETVKILLGHTTWTMCSRPLEMTSREAREAVAALGEGWG